MGIYGVMVPILGLQSLLVTALIFMTLSDNLLLGVVGEVNCYVCSWSPRDMVNGSVVRDACTTNNFRPEVATQVECLGGCESVTYSDFKNGEIRHFHRNCVALKADTTRQDKCEDIQGRIQFERKCECYSNLCNSSPVRVPWELGIQMAFTATILVTVSLRGVSPKLLVPV